MSETKQDYRAKWTDIKCVKKISHYAFHIAESAMEIAHADEKKWMLNCVELGYPCAVTETRQSVSPLLFKLTCPLFH